MVSTHSVPHAQVPVLFRHGHGTPGTPAPAACAHDAGWLVGSTADEIQRNEIRQAACGARCIPVARFCSGEQEGSDGLMRNVLCRCRILIKH